MRLDCRVPLITTKPIQLNGKSEANKRAPLMPPVKSEFVPERNTKMCKKRKIGRDLLV